ncbi:phosphatase PAP2 family protein [Jatrophihabitans sp. DSM 45814]
MTVTLRPGGDWSDREAEVPRNRAGGVSTDSIDRSESRSDSATLLSRPSLPASTAQRILHGARYQARRIALAPRLRDGVLQLLCALALWMAYLFVVHNVPINEPAAAQHGRDLLTAERWLHLDIERWLQSGLLHSNVLGVLAAWEYALAYIVSTFGVLALTWWRRGAGYPWARNVLAWTTLIAIIFFALYPVTPPRLLPNAGFVDVVSQHRPPFSWGNANVSAAADQHAAMPSLHTAWGIWVLLVAVRLGRSRWAAVLAALQLTITVLVIVATANHYLLDAVGGAVLIAVAVLVERHRSLMWKRIGPRLAPRLKSPLNRIAPVFVARGPSPALASPALTSTGAMAAPDPRPSDSGATESAVELSAPHVGRSRSTGRGERMAAQDEFFLHVESAAVQQPVGGFVLLDRTRAARTLDLAAMRELVAAQYRQMPRFTECVKPAGRFRHARWMPAEVDIDWHVRELVLPGAGGRRELANAVARLAEQELDRSRPMWQLWFVPNVGPDESAAIAIMHHSFADGLGVVDILRMLFEPVLPLPDLSAFAPPALPIRLAAGATGLVGLARDGLADKLSFTRPLNGQRDYSFAMTSLDGVQRLARETQTRVTDVLLAATTEVLGEIVRERGIDPNRQELRAAVPVTTRLPAPAGTGRRAQPGNLTAALRLDVPLAPMSVVERIRRTASMARVRRRSGRALATTFVMRVIGVLPPPLHGAAARAMYHGRFFNVIVSNMPGPTESLAMAGAPILDVYPIIPLAECVPVGVGTLGWAGQFCVSVIVDVAVLPEAAVLHAGDGLAGRVVAVIEKAEAELAESTGLAELAESTQPDDLSDVDGEVSQGAS